MKSIKRSWGISNSCFLWSAFLVLICLLTDGQEQGTAGVLRKHSAAVKALAVSIDGKTIATGGDDKMICLWDIQSRQLIGTIENNAAVKALQFTTSGTMLAACGPDIKLIDQSGRLIRTYGGYTTDIRSVSYNENRRRITAGSYSKTIKVWDFETGKQVMNLEGSGKSCLPVSFSPDGSLIVSGSLDKTVRLWDAATGNQKALSALHTEDIFAVDFHPSGKYYVSASADKSIRLWSTEDGKIVRTFTGHEGAVFDVWLSSDGNHLVSCAADRSVILWESATGKKLYTFTGHEGMVNAVRFSRDGQYIISVSDDKTVRIWPVEKKCYVEQFYKREIEEAITASPLFGPRRDDETRQAFAEREQKADAYLDTLYDEYYKQYAVRLSKLTIEDNSQ